MAKHVTRRYDCQVIHEQVQIYLKNRRSVFSSKEDEYFVQCDQSECQYSEENKLPCPLSTSMYDEEINEKAEERRRRKEDAENR